MSEHTTTIDQDAWDDVVLGAKGPVVVDFFSTECPPCEALAPKFDAMAEVYGDDVRFVKIFRQGNREISTKLGVGGSPTVLYFNNGAEVGERLTGGIRRDALEQGIAALLPDERVAELQRRKTTAKTDVDVLIIGGGPAGLTAGIYTAQAKLHTLIVDRALSGGNLNITHTVSNFPGFADPQPGYLLAHNMRQQAVNAGCEFREATDITSIDLDAHQVVLDGVETVTARKIIVATGSSPRVIGVEGERENQGRGISYCATCDAKYYEGKHVVVIGGGNSAIEESLFISRFASRITIVHQFDTLQANRVAQEKAFADPKISFLFKHEPRAFVREGNSIGRVRVQDLTSGEEREIACDGVFIFAGMKPNLELLDGQLDTDDWGYVRVDADMHTNHKDVFAIGDIASKRYRQMTTAVSDGTIAAMRLAQELDGH